MIFQRVEIYNFGPFYGQFDFKLPTADRKVVVIHGKNGSGKTTIARVFLWTLYGILDLKSYSVNESASQDEKIKKIVNSKAFREAQPNQKIEVKCVIEFLHGGASYTVERSISVLKISEDNLQILDKDQFKVIVTPKNSSSIKLEGRKAQQAIGKVLPQSMSDYFFFKGELMEKLSMPSESKKIRDAIETVFGFNILYDLKKYLVKTETDIYERQSRESKINKKLEQLVALRSESNDKLTEKRELLDNIKKEIRTIEDNISKKESYLDERKEIAKEQAEKRDLYSRIAELKKRNELISQRIDDELISSSYQVFSQGLYSEIEPILIDAKNTGKIPSSLVSPQVVDKIIEQAECICGTEIVEGSPARKKLEELIRATYRGDLEENHEKFRESFVRLETEIVKSSKLLHDNYKDLSDNLITLEEFEEEVKYLEDKLKDHKDINIADEQRKIDVLNSERIDLKRKEQQLSIDVSELEKEIADINAQFKKEEGKSGEIGKWSKILELIEIIKVNLDSIIQKSLSSNREKFEEKLNEVYKKIHTKPYHIKLNQNFEMQICEEKNGKSIPVPSASEGEFKITSLTFITSLIEFAKEVSTQMKRESGILFGGGEYSLVIDAPFGDLDSEYRSETARAICNMNTQVIILLSDTHWDKNVSEIMTPFKGKEFIITHIGSKADVPFKDSSYFYRKKGSTQNDDQYCTIEEIL